MQFSFRVFEVNQAASSGSYVVGFRAEGRTTSCGNVTVTIESVRHPEYDDQELQEMALKNMTEGFCLVASDLNIGVEVSIHNLILHPVDYKPNRQRMYSACYLAEAIGHEDPGTFLIKALPTSIRDALSLT